MEYRRLGNSGLRVSVAGLGCNNFGERIDDELTRAVIHRALDEGINLFDTAEVYGWGRSEELIGKFLGSRRHEVIIATKFGYRRGPIRNASRDALFKSCEASLRRLNTDYIDLYQLHQPDPQTPQEETLRAADDLVRAGKVRYIGCSTFTGWLVAEAIGISRLNGYAPYVSAQNHYNLLERGVEKELIPACEHYGLGILPFYPLAAGMLSGKYKFGVEPAKDTRAAISRDQMDRHLTERNFAKVERLKAFVKARGHSLVELALSWLVNKPIISSVIAGAHTPEQISENAKAGAWKLSAEEMAELDQITL